MDQKVRDALSQLDPAKDEHWTSDGLPRLDVLKDLSGQAITRETLNTEAKGFTRANPSLDVAPAPAQPPADKEQSEPEQETTEQTVEAEFKAANANLDKAKKRLNKATEAMDEVIAAREKSRTKADAALDIKAYQRSQAAIRAKDYQTRKHMEEFLKGNLK